MAKEILYKNENQEKVNEIRYRELLKNFIEKLNN